MKELETTFATFLLLLTTIPMLQSCLDDDWNGSTASLLIIGAVRIIDEKDYYFALGEGTKAFPGDTTRVNNYVLAGGQCAFVHLDPLDKKVDRYDYNAQINHAENILTKDIYFVPVERVDSIDDDRINTTNMWIADNCLGIQYQLCYSGNPDEKHMLNPVVNEASDGKNDKEGYITLEFRRNACDNEPNIPGPGIVSSKLGKIADQMAGKTGLNIRVRSVYDGKRYMTIDFAE